MLKLFENSDTRPFTCFFKIFFIKHASLKWFYLSLKLLQSRTIFRQKGNHEVSSHSNFCMKFFTTPNSKNIIATLRIITIESWHSFLYYISMVQVTLFFKKRKFTLSKSIFFHFKTPNKQMLVLFRTRIVKSLI